jgi:NAD(P)-dependent dehydrogenase (short-subunit alcohol dehydrogenase family)
MRKLSELMDLHGRTALITGGAGNIGKAMAAALAEQGAKIIILDIDEERAKDVAKKISLEFDVDATGFGIDLENEAEVFSVPDRLSELRWGLDILINNAAFCGTSSLQGWGVPFENQLASTWRRALEVNLTAVFELTQSCYSLLKKSRNPSVINVSSIYGALGPDMSLYEGTNMGNPAAYAASKGGLIQLTRWLSTTLSPLVRVNCISPGGVERGQPVEFQDRYIKKVPLGRLGSEEDMKGITLFLASDMSSYITGQNLMVDGGFSSW